MKSDGHADEIVPCEGTCAFCEPSHPDNAQAVRAMDALFGVAPQPEKVDTEQINPSRSTRNGCRQSGRAEVGDGDLPGGL